MTFKPIGVGTNTNPQNFVILLQKINLIDTHCRLFKQSDVDFEFLRHKNKKTECM